MAWFDHDTSRIYYEEQGSGDAVLLLPGFAGSIAEFSALRESLAARYRVIAADLPGSGRSQPQPRAYPPSFYADDARAFAALLAQLAAGATHLLGFSDGGEVALLMAAATPAIARSVVTWGAAGALDEGQRPNLALLADIVDNPVEGLQGFSDSLKAVYGEANARATIQSFVVAVGAIIDRGGDISLSRAGDIACPVLLIVGEDDGMAPPALVSQLATHIRSVEVIEVAGVGHGVYDERPEWLTQTISDWLEQHSGQAA
jgi:valacyclovir hydrolase